MYNCTMYLVAQLFIETSPAVSRLSCRGNPDVILGVHADFVVLLLGKHKIVGTGTSLTVLYSSYGG